MRPQEISNATQRPEGWNEMAQARLLSMTVILTALIWASADSLVNEAVVIGVLFEPMPGTADMLVASAAATQQFDIQISGPRRIVDDIQSQAPLHARLRIPELPTGATDVPLDRTYLKQQLTEQWPQFRKLTIVSVAPSAVPVVIDHWITAQVELVTARLALAYDVEPQLERSTISARLRESKLRNLPSPNALQLDVSSDIERVLREQPAGQNVSIPVTLTASAFGADAELTPKTITVGATIKAKRSTVPIPTVPILVAVSFANLEKPVRAVSRDGTPLSLVTHTITVTGPSDEVAKLARGTTRAYGVIHLKQDDLDDLGSLKLKTPEYHLPPGLELAISPEPIEFKLINTTDTEKSSGG